MKLISKLTILFFVDELGMFLCISAHYVVNMLQIILKSDISYNVWLYQMRVSTLSVLFC